LSELIDDLVVAPYGDLRRVSPRPDPQVTLMRHIFQPRPITLDAHLVV